MHPGPHTFAKPQRRIRVPTAVRGWLVVAFVLVLAVVLIWVSGGFGRLPGYMGREATPGQTIETEFWDFTVNDAHVLLDRGRPSEILIDIRIMSKLRSSTNMGITYDTVALYLPDQGDMLWLSVCSHDEDSSFDPYIRVDAVCRFDPSFEGIALQYTEPTNVQVVIFDQEYPEYDFQRTREPVAVAPPVYYVPFQAPWRTGE